MTQERPPIDWDAVKHSYQEDGDSLRAIGKEFGISHAAVAKRAKKEGWVRGPQQVSAVDATDTMSTGVVLDAKTGLPDPTPSILGRLNLASARDVRVAIARVIRGEIAGKIEHNRARGLVWMMRELASVIAIAEIEPRLAALEALPAPHQLN